jgi:predicted DNA-binding transcriptional regulator YafY
VGSTIIRQWHLLTLLPKGPRRIDSATLADRLRARGLHAHRRTIQRDLVELATVFPIVSDERSKPYGWRWGDDAELLCAIPALPGARDGAQAIDLVLRVRRSAVRAVSEGLRGAEGQATEVRVDGRDPLASLVEVVARARDGCALRRWLFGFADAVEVIAPVDLRAELAGKAARIATLYDGAS